LGEAQTAVNGAFRNRYAKLNLKIKNSLQCVFLRPMEYGILRWEKERLYGLLLRSGGVFPLGGQGRAKRPFPGVVFRFLAAV
jgi:hypothetical protein